MKFPLLLAVLLPALFLRAQTGPAGVGNTSSTIVWLKADAGTSTTVNTNPLSQWNDQSGNANHLSQSSSVLQPLYCSGISGQLNGMPAVEFDNNSTNNDYLNCADNSTLDNYAGMTAFSAFRFKTGTPAGTPRCIFSKRIDPSSQNDFGWFNYTSNYFYLDVNGTTSRMNTTTVYNDNTDYLIGFSYDGAAASNRQKMYNDNTLNVQSANPSVNVPNYASDFHVGILYGHTGSSKQFNGYISEVIVYNQVLNPAQRFIVNNYLSSKYNIALSANDYYAGDTPANGDFDREVAGIGQSAAGNTNNAFSSSVCGGMGITYVSGFDDGDYILAGNNLPVNTNYYTDLAVVAGGPLVARWQRVWYVDVTNTGTAMSTTVSFDLSDGGFTGTAGNASDYKLLYRSTNSGSWTIVATATSTSGDQISFPGVNFNTNDGYYTIGTLAATLPVEWLYFNARLDEQAVQLNWATATEQNADYFAIERADNGITYSEIGRIAAAGNSSQVHTYAAVDANPAGGMNYYRLREVDLNGTVHYSVLKSVELVSAETALRTYPNPSGESFTLELGKSWMEEQTIVSVYAVDGKLVQTLSTAEMSDSSFTLSLSPGVYLIRAVAASGRIVTARQIVR